MQVTTTKNNIYSYLRRTGEIVSGVVDDERFVWSFEPLHSFSAMPEVDMFILGITEQCNLRYTYCCYSGEYKSNRLHSSHSMSKEDIDDIYSFIQKLSVKRPYRIAFYGGEPLLQFDLLKYAIDRAEELWTEEVTFSVTTNGTLLSKEKADWLMNHHVRIEISIDGTASFHDRHRVDQSGIGSYSRMYEALSYMIGEYPEIISNIQLLMTLPSVGELPTLAEEWNNDVVLRNLAPSHITGLAPNFDKGVKMRDWDELQDLYLRLLDVYEQHQDWLVLKAFFDDCIAYWKGRPIMDIGVAAVPMSTCMPRNTKLYIDSRKQIAVCEKISDNYRIGTIQDGIDWGKANEQVQTYYNKKVRRCTHCSAIQMCDLCLTAVEFDDDQWDVLCHNERVYARLYMLLFCEMAERRLIA